MKGEKNISTYEEPAIQSLTDIFLFFKSNIIILLLIVIIASLGYYNGLTGDFLNADDIQVLLLNERARNFKETLSTFNIYPITQSALLTLFGSTPVPFHIVSLILHIFNSFIVLLLAYILIGRKYAHYTALLFSILPTGSEAILWISGATYLFQAFFIYIVLLLYLIYTSSAKMCYLVASIIIFLLFSLFHRTPWMLIAPLLVIVLDLFVIYEKKQTRTSKKGWGMFYSYIKSKWYLGLYVLVSLLYGMSFLATQLSSRLEYMNNEFYTGVETPAPYFVRLPYTIFKTLELYIYPMHLTFYHEEPIPTYFWFVVLSAVLTLIATGILLYKRNSYGGLILAVFLSSAPTLSPIQVGWFVAERYLYLGGAFYCMLLSVALVILASKLKFTKYHRVLPTLAVTLIVVLYVIRIFLRSQDFKSSKMLWWATREESPYSYRVYNNLGAVYSAEKNYPMSIYYYNKTIEMSPDYAPPYMNLGLTYYILGNLDKSKFYLLEAYKRYDQLYQALEKLAQIEYTQGNLEQAREYIILAKRIKPDLKTNLKLD